MNKYDGFDDRYDLAVQFAEGTGSRWRKEDPFVPASDFPTDEEILIACYVNEEYEGSAFVLFQRDGKLYEVNGSHCSCYGLEGQWKPEETSFDAILKRKRGYGMSNETWEFVKQLANEAKAEVN